MKTGLPIVSIVAVHWMFHCKRYIIKDFGGMCSIDFLAFTLKLPFPTLLSVASHTQFSGWPYNSSKTSTPPHQTHVTIPACNQLVYEHPDPAKRSVHTDLFETTLAIMTKDGILPILPPATVVAVR